MSNLSLHPVVSYPVVVAVAIVLLALVWVGPGHVHLSPLRRGVLALLRVLVVLLAVVAMLRPTIEYVETKPLQASLVLLLDSSRSMQVQDSIGDLSRWEAVKSLLAEAGNDLAGLDESWDVKAYRFGAETDRVSIRDGQLELPERAEGEQSAIGAALEDVLDREASERVLALMLLSDGAQRAVAPLDLPPQTAARRLTAENIPLYTFTFGKSGGSERADLAIEDLVTNETIFADAPTEVRGQLRAQGYANQTVRVQLLWESADGMEVVDTVQVTTGAEGQVSPVVLRHTPRTPGEYKVTLRIEPREGELVTTNNEASTFVTVRKGGINVLYLVGATRIGGGPGLEQRFVRAALSQSPDIVLQRRVLNYQPPQVDLQDVLKQDELDVVILDDVDAQALDEASWQTLANRVREGVGLMMIGGYHSFGPGGFRDNPLADVLPIDIGPAQRQNFGETVRQDVHLSGPLTIRPTDPIGRRHPILQIAGEGPSSSPSTWSELPPLDGANLIARGELKPNALVLAEVDDAQGHPLLIAGQSGTGRVLAFAGDSTWRWQMEGFSDAHRRFWRQCVLWLAKKDEETDGRVWIRLAGRRAMRGSRVDFSVGAEDAQREPIPSARFDVDVQMPDGTTVDLRPTRSGDAWAAIFRDTSVPGDYRIAVTARDGSEELGTAEARFLVPDQDIELDRPAAEPSLMAQLAQMTASAGGQALAAEELPDLLQRLAAQPPELKEEVVDKITYWDTWPFFMLFVGLIVLEWYLRKRWGLV
jgi:uncharacterized membrane protein